jgi:hypothetical protein
MSRSALVTFVPAIVGCCLVAAASPTPASAAWLGSPTKTDLGATVRGVAVGRINTDPSDHREFVVAATGGANVSVMQVEPGGNLTSPTQIPVPGEAISVAIGDVNGDGHNDIVVGSTDESSIIVVPGHGNGTFGGEPIAQVTSPGPYTHDPVSLALGRFDGDGNLDLVTANGPAPGADPTTISTFKGNGDGSFTLTENHGVGNTYQSASRVNVADLNGSGNVDLVSADENCGGVAEGHQIAVFLGDGAGAFTQEGERFGQCVQGLDTGDVNGDGFPDIIVSRHVGVFDNASSVEVALGNGNGTFQPFVASPAESGAEQIAAGDFNGDGRSDVAVAAGSGDIASGSSGHEPELTLMESNGDGTFSEVETVPLAGSPGDIAYGDLNGSGNPPDLVVANGSAVTVFPNVILGPVAPAPLPSTGDLPLTGSALAPGAVIFNSRTLVGRTEEVWDFTDADREAEASDYAVSVDWGDGSTSAGGVSESCLGENCFFATGAAHAYLRPGTFTATAHINDVGGRKDAGGNSISIPVAISVIPLLTLKQKHVFARLAKMVHDNSTDEFIVSIITGAGGLFTGPFAIPVGLLSLGIAADSYSKGEQARTLEQLANDPPAGEFQSIISPVMPPGRKLPRRIPAGLRRSLQGVMNGGRQEFAQVQALLISLERAQGAAAANDSHWTIQQMHAAATFAATASTILRRNLVRSRKLKKFVRRMPKWNPMLPVTQIKAAQQMVRRHGVPHRIHRMLRRLGATATYIRDLRQKLLATPPHRLSGRLFGQLVSRARLMRLRNMADILSEYAAAINAAAN